MPKDIYKDRAGTFMDQGIGYKSFIPNKLPPNPPIVMDDEILEGQSLADRKLGRLDGITQILPNPELFIAMYVKKEALLSSQIEGTQASLIDVLNIENKSKRGSEVNEVINYIEAMNYGLKRLNGGFPLSLRLIMDIHKRLIAGVRGNECSPGEFRRTQNWIGPQGCTLKDASFVPPHIEAMKLAMNDLELFFHEKNRIPALIKIALIHAQFETIHPFIDGNGRIGRLLITFWLCQQGILSEPLLYLSYYFKKNRFDYYDHLMEIRTKGDWEGWIKFFLRGVAETADEATNTAKQILKLKEEQSRELYSLHNNTTHMRLYEMLYNSPVITKRRAKELLNVSYPTAGSIIEDFCNMKILIDTTPNQRRNKNYIFIEYVKILERGTELIDKKKQQKDHIG